MTSSWSRIAASLASRSCASTPPTRRVRVDRRARRRGPPAPARRPAPSRGPRSSTASSSTCSPSPPARRTDCTPSTPATAARTAAALSAGAMTTVGWDAPAGKCRASTCCPVTDSGFARNCSVWDRPLVMPTRGSASSTSSATPTAVTSRGRAVTTAATLAQKPSARRLVVADAWHERPEQPAPEDGHGRGQHEQGEPDGRDDADGAGVPDRRLEGFDARTPRHSSASVTVPELARMAGAARPRATRIASYLSASRRSSSRYRAISSSA